MNQKTIDADRRREDRLGVEEELLMLGVTYAWIAEAIGISLATFQKDVRVLVEMGLKLDAEALHKGAFSRVLHRYAVLNRIVEEGRQVAPITIRKHELLGLWLRKREIIAHLHGVKQSMDILTTSAYPAERAGYVRLLEAALGTKQIDEEHPELFWGKYLLAIAAVEQAPTFDGWMDLRRDMTEQWIARVRSAIAPILGDQTIARVDAALQTLTEREARIIRSRFGIGEKTHTLDELAVSWEVHRERIRQIEVKALRKLRHPSRRLGGFLNPVGNALERQLAREAVEEEQKRQFVEVQKQDIAGGVTLEQLLVTMNQLELSVRSANCLGAAGIIFVGDFVQKTEGELLRTKNFGRKSLREVKEILQVISPALRVGMVLPDALKAAFEAQKALVPLDKR